MPSRCSYKTQLLLLSICAMLLPVPTSRVDAQDRETPLVKAVANVRAAVVNLRGRKTVSSDASSLSSDTVKQVNGMGTGVIIDPRGYVLTNYHVVDGVQQIQVTTVEGHQTTGKLVAHDPETDLAILKIESDRPLKTIEIGTSSDLMLAETVAAVGNAYGYEHTVTVGIISQLGRTVQVNDDQIYRNLIQTDAPINPGNSGGPLLNLEGKMIGINVAVRIGAQGIAFAIPANDAMQVASDLMKSVGADRLTHGLVTRTVYEDHQPKLMIEEIRPESPAAELGLSSGDVITRIDDQNVARCLDLQCALLDRAADSTLQLDIVQPSGRRTVQLVLAQNTQTISRIGWKSLGVSVSPVTENEMANRHPNYRRGLRVIEVRRGSPAEKEGILEGDILVAMHGWKTETIENLEYILQQPDVKSRQNFMFYILREQEPFWGQMRIASASQKR
ncbi:MAG: trypsin-like peptidase domain-containing protein [Mariniblastus sp.]|nr:trypsin-like peptidase domain-containing protein [Mariniblastus sp.]